MPKPKKTHDVSNGDSPPAQPSHGLAICFAITSR